MFLDLKKDRFDSSSNTRTHYYFNHRSSGVGGLGPAGLGRAHMGTPATGWEDVRRFGGRQLVFFSDQTRGTDGWGPPWYRNVHSGPRIQKSNSRGLSVHLH